MLQSPSGLSASPPMLPKTGHENRDQNGHCEDTAVVPPFSLDGTASIPSGSCSPSTPTSTTITANYRTPRPETIISVSSSLAKDSNINHSHRPFPPSSHFTNTSHYARESFVHPFAAAGGGGGGGGGGHRPLTGVSVGHLSHHNHPSHYNYYNQHSSHHHHNPHPHHHSYHAHHYAHSNSHGYTNTSPTPVSRAQTATHQLQDFMLGQWTQFKRNSPHATLVQSRIPPPISNASTANCSPSEDSATTSPSPTPHSSGGANTDRGLPSSRAPDYNLNGSLPRKQAVGHPEGGPVVTEFASSGVNYRRRGGPVSQLSRQSSSDATLWQRGHPGARKTSSPTTFTGRGPTVYACNRPTGQSGYSTAAPARASNASPSQMTDRCNVNNNACLSAGPVSHGFSGSTPSSPGSASQPSSLRGSPAHSKPRRSVPDRPIPRECSSPALSKVRASPEPVRPATPQSPKVADAQSTSDKPGKEPDASPDSSASSPVLRSSVTATDRSSPTVCHTVNDANPLSLETRTLEVSSTESLSNPQSAECALSSRMNLSASAADYGGSRLERAVSECIDKQLTSPMRVNVTPSTAVSSSKHDRADTPTASEQYWTPDPPASPSNGNTFI
ncbi:unnamed protein product, partial [Dicrocoelium dendriticum]